MDYNLITILGPTAVGKTELAALLANEFNGEIISADSRQVYIGMDIGTGKDYSDYIVDNVTVPYHLIDIIEPSEEFNLYMFLEKFYEAYNNIKNRNKIPFLTGGTGLYLSSVIQNYSLTKVDFYPEYDKLNNQSHEELKAMLLKLKPELHNTTDLIDKERTIKRIIIEKASADKNEKKEKINSLVIGISPDRNEIKKRITERLKKRLEEGMIDEVKNLLKKGISYNKLDFFGLEYRYIGRHIKGELNYNDMFQKLNSSIHKFAKRQMTWFRKMEKEGVEIHWIESADYTKAKNIIKENLNL